MTKYSNVTPYRETNNFFASPTLYENIKEFLHSEIIEVAFTKKNGDDRVMKCTLMSDQFPEELKTEKKVDHNELLKEENKDVMAVFDVEAQGWRSFRLDTVKYIKTNLESV
jgi:hypothetical protein|tara:strand:- start:3319 stop:3651 length:333 start_codon:yes stop_codon:yes gene_type:complete